MDMDNGALPDRHGTHGSSRRHRRGRQPLFGLFGLFGRGHPQKGGGGANEGGAQQDAEGGSDGEDRRERWNRDLDKLADFFRHSQSLSRQPDPKSSGNRTSENGEKGLDCRQSVSSVITTPKQVLEETGYVVEFDSDDTAYFVNVKWKGSEGQFIIQWNPTSGILESNFDNIHIPCPDYAVGVAINMIVKTICTRYKYPYKWVTFRDHGSPAAEFYVDMQLVPEAVKQAGFLGDIYQSICQNGFNKEHADAARRYNVVDGLNAIIFHTLGVTVAPE